MRVLTVLCGALVASAVLAQPALALPDVGKPAPDFTVTDFDGHEISLKALRGQVVVVNFWATWCAPCKHELPLLDAFYRVAKPHGLAVVAVTTEDSVPLEELKPLAKALAIPLARRFRGGNYKAPTAVPTNYVIDRAGVLRYAKAGAFDLDAMNRILLPLLKEPTPETSERVAAPASSSTR